MRFQPAIDGRLPAYDQLPTGAVVLLITALMMTGTHVLEEIGRKAHADIQADEDAIVGDCVA